MANPEVNVMPFYIEVEEGTSHRLAIEHAFSVRLRCGQANRRLLTGKLREAVEV